MARLRTLDAETERRKRELRSALARSRRRLDEQLAASAREAKSLVSWRTYVRRFPQASLAAAFGLGLVLSAGVSRRAIRRRLGRRIVIAALGLANRRLWPEIVKLWNETAPRRRQ